MRNILKMTTKEIRLRFERLKGRKDQIREDIKTFKKQKKNIKKQALLHEQAKLILTEVGLKTQKQIQFHISDITSLALEAVFEEPYKLILDFVQRRNKTECDIYFERDGQRVDPISASGGGTVDIAAFALRIASWTLHTPRLRNTIIMDEPMRFVSKEYREQASLMIKEISKQLGIQFIIVTHDPVLTKHADMVFETTIKRGITKIKGSQQTTLY